MTNAQVLPDNWKLEKLNSVCLVNPPRSRNLGRNDDEETTFIPMNAVNGDSGIIEKPEIRPYSAVKKGYTYFEEGDVLFAKITPCMENGKHAIASDLIDGIGFGTTEFHVLRPGSAITSKWLHFYLRQPDILKRAAASFTGSVGQQRVPPDFLKSLCIPIPPLAEQQRIAAAIEARLSEVERARAAVQAQRNVANELMAVHLRGVFEDAENLPGENLTLGDILIRSTEIIHPGDKSTGAMPFVGLEHIKGGTGLRIGAVEMALGELTGRKPVFHSGQIVYGYLRPYLNKVWIAEFDGLCSVDQYVYSVRDSLALADYIAWFMRSPLYMERSPVGSNTSQLPRIRLEEVASVEISLPSKSDQEAILSRIHEARDSAFQAVAALTSQLELLDCLPAAILRQAFAGDL